MVTKDFMEFKSYIAEMTNNELLNHAKKYQVGYKRMLLGNHDHSKSHKDYDEISKRFMFLIKSLCSICDKYSNKKLSEDDKETATTIREIILELNSISPKFGVKTDLTLRFYNGIKQSEDMLAANKLKGKLIKKIKKYFRYYLSTGKMPYKYPSWFCRDMLTMMSGFNTYHNRGEYSQVTKELFENALADVAHPIVYSEQYTNQFWDLKDKTMRSKLNLFITAVSNSFGENGLIINENGARYWVMAPEMCFLELPFENMSETFVNYRFTPFITTAYYNKRINHPILFKFDQIFLPIVAVLTFLASFLAVIIPLFVK